MMNCTANMLTGNSHVYHANVDAAHVACFFDGFLNGKHGFIDVGNDAFDNTFTFGFAHAKHFELTEFILATNDGTYFCCSDIEADYYFPVFHDLLFLVVVFYSLFVYLMSYILCLMSILRLLVLRIPNSLAHILSIRVGVKSFYRKS